MIKNILKTLKVNHYIKNLVVVIPLIFSMNYFNIEAILKTLGIFFAFCFISSAVYVMNDIIDIENDRRHPIKSKRPIASGKIQIPLAIALLVMLLCLSSIISYSLNLLSFIGILSYFILNILYSLYLKNIALVDVACIAVGFVIRIVSGCFAISVYPSPLVVLLTFFASMFFTFSKRKLELQLIEDENSCRASIRGFDIATVNQFILLNAILSIAFYFTYVLDKTTIERAGSDYLYITVIPFTLLVFRLLFLINTSKIDDDPIHYIEKDKTLKVLFIFYLIIFGILMFFK